MCQMPRKCDAQFIKKTMIIVKILEIKHFKTILGICIKKKYCISYPLPLSILIIIFEL